MHSLQLECEIITRKVITHSDHVDLTVAWPCIEAYMQLFNVSIIMGKEEKEDQMPDDNIKTGISFSYKVKKSSCSASGNK